MNPSVSIVIPNHNYGDYVAAAIESALAQSVPADEIIVVDDGSTDHSREILGRYSDRVRVHFRENGGQAAAINTGIQLATSEWVHFLDADDTLLPTAVESLHASGLLREGVVRILWPVEVTDAEGGFIRLKPSDPASLQRGDLLRMVTEGEVIVVPGTSAMLFRGSSLQAVYPVPEDTYRRCADNYLVWRLIDQGSVEAITKPLTRYRVHGANMYGSEDLPGFDRLQLDLAVGLANHQIEKELLANPDLDFFDSNTGRRKVTVTRLLYGGRFGFLPGDPQTPSFARAAEVFLQRYHRPGWHRLFGRLRLLLLRLWPGPRSPRTFYWMDRSRFFP